MKTNILIGALFALVLVAFSSCNARNAEKATKAIEKRLNQEESEALQAYKNFRRAQRAEELLNQSQPHLCICSRCGGCGTVCLTDGYGRVMFDSYGNPAVITCPMCIGSGVVYCQ